MRSTRSLQIYLLGLFLLAGLAAFSLNLNSWFLSDDFVQIGKVLRGDFSVAWGHEHGGFFRPLFILSYILDSRLWGVRPFGYHLTNVIVHGLNAFLVFRLAVGIFPPITPEPRMRRAIAICAGALFLLHPSHSEAVVWISGRADLIATCFALASLLLYLAFEDQARRSYLFASAACFVLALLAKESAVCLPLLILIAGAYRSRRRTIGHFLKVCAVYLAILFAFIIIRAWSIGAIVGGYGTAQHLNFSPGWIRDRLLEAIVRSILPPLPSAWVSFLFKPLQSPVFYLTVLLVATGIGIATFARRRRYGSAERKVQNQFLLTLAGMFLVALLPVINLRLSLYETLGERFLYLPTVFACMLIAYVAAVLIRNASAMLLLVLIIAGCYSWSLYRTNLRWREAAELSRTISRQLADSVSQPRLVVLNAPDNLRGVPVFHNGLPEAIAWLQGNRAIPEVQIVSFQDLQSAHDETIITGEVPLNVHALNRADIFTRVNSTDCLEASNPASDTLALYPKPCAASGEIFFVSVGRIKRLTNQ
jgi:protein O-mannosyl-transferase